MASMDDGCKGEIDLPVIDLSVLNPSDLQADRSMTMSSPLVELISKIRDACQETGFFHVINHGIEEKVTKGVDSAARDLFGVASEVKEKPVSMYSWYSFIKRAESTYAESVHIERVLRPDSTQRISDVVWPDGNPKFCKAIQEYSSMIDALAKALMKLIVLSLGFDTSSEYYESFFEKSCDSTLRLTFCVPSTNRQPSARALATHTDISFITILYHDIPAGLELQTKDGDWLRVKPLANSFIVVVGDATEIWSNCRYVSTPHRVIDAGWSSRLNVSLFLTSKDEMELYAPEQLVDEDHPRRYAPFVFKDFKDYKYKFMLSWPKEKEDQNISPFLQPPTPIPTPLPLLSS